MSLEDFSLYLRKRMRENNLSITETAKRTGISRSALNKYLSNDVKDGKISTFVSLGHTLNEHPLTLLSIFFHAQNMGRVSSVMPNRTKSLLPQDDIGFIADITYPDNSPVARASTFVKTWRIKNLGSIPWENRRLVCVDENLIITSDKKGLLNQHNTGLEAVDKEIIVPFTAPNCEVDLSVVFTAPKIPCTVVSHWKMINEQSKFFFPDTLGLYCQVQVMAF